MDEFFIDEPCQRLPPSCVNYCRASRQQYPALRLPLSEPCSQLYEALDDVADDTPMGALGRDLRLHKAEHIAITGPLERNHPHTLTADYNLISPLHVSHRNSTSRQAHRVYANSQIHLNPLHLHPLVMHTHLSGQMGCRVKLVGKDAVCGRHTQPAIPFTLDRRAVGLNGMENFAEQFRGRSPHDNPGS